MIILQKVSKSFPDGTLALDKVSFQINKKEFVFFIGPSGAGKTTVMRLLRREIRPTSGSIIVMDKNLNDMEEGQVPYLRREVGMCYQDFKLLSDRTVYENVALSLEITGMDKEKIDKRVAEVLKSVGLAKKANFFPIQISGGELQRVGIARALAPDPKILVADEPTGNLDPESGWEIIKLFKEINLSGTTVLVATHNAEVVDKFKERVITLKDGKMVSDKKKGGYGKP